MPETNLFGSDGLQYQKLPRFLKFQSFTRKEYRNLKAGCGRDQGVNRWINLRMNTHSNSETLRQHFSGIWNQSRRPVISSHLKVNHQQEHHPFIVRSSYNSLSQIFIIISIGLMKMFTPIIMLSLVLSALSLPEGTFEERRMLVQLNPQGLPTNPNRTSNVNRYCSVSRTSLISSEELTASRFNHQSLASLFPGSGYNRFLYRLHLLGGLVRS